MKRLTRKEIEQGLESMPVETLLLGVSTSKEKRLTPSEIKFAKELALGKSKAEAFRQSRPNGRKSKASPRTASRKGQELAKSDAIQAQVSAFKVALEAQKYQTPAHLRALAIHKITEKVLDKDCPPAQQLKALELLGKITEVALFTERREVVKVSDPSEMREKLMASIRLAIENSQAIDIEAKSADDLLAELVGTGDQDQDVAGDDVELDDVDGKETSLEVADGSQKADLADPLGADPQILALQPEPNLHSIPHNQSEPNSNQPRENPASL
jgi:hypothetical protein